MSLILDPTIKQLIILMYTHFQGSSFKSSLENCDTNIQCK